MEKINYIIDNKQRIKVKREGKKFAEIVYCKNRNRSVIIRRLDKLHYEKIDLKTGEVEEKEYKNNSENRSENLANLQRTFNNLIGIIRTNFTGYSKKQLFLTLTYAENMQDKDKLYKDFDNFRRKLYRKYKDHKFDYVSVAEPQGRGAWHFHIMLKSDKNLYIDNRELEKLWGHGTTEVDRLKSDDVGTYYSSYFTNAKAEVKEGENNNKKKYIKGSRLHFYPNGFKFYRCSRGIKRPTEEFNTYDKVVEEFGNPIWEQGYEFKDKDEKTGYEKPVNIVYKATFKKGHKLKDIKDNHLRGLYKREHKNWREEENGYYKRN